MSTLRKTTARLKWSDLDFLVQRNIAALLQSQYSSNNNNIIKAQMEEAMLFPFWLVALHV